MNKQMKSSQNKPQGLETAQNKELPVKFKLRTKTINKTLQESKWSTKAKRTPQSIIRMKKI
jgi:hypothetical protein